MSSKLKIGIIGLGKMGITHACLLNVLPNVKVAALCDSSRLMRTLAKRAFSDALITDEVEEFSRTELDGIYV